MGGELWTQKVGFSSQSEDWATPMDFFGPLNAEFDFTLDPCCSDWNRKCPRGFTVEQDGLAQPWAPARVFLNPPYGHGIARWIAKARAEQESGALVVALLPARTDTAWWHDHVERKASEVRFIRGRLKFVCRDGRRNNAPFPSAVAVYRPKPR